MTPHRPSPEDVTVVVCTRDRLGQLSRCLISLGALRPSPGEVLVIDNNDTRVVEPGHLRLAESAGVVVRCVHEPRRGLNRARAAAVRDAAGSVIAFTDDDCEVDPTWVDGLVRAFDETEAEAVTGRVVAANLVDGPPTWFEARFSFDRGPSPRTFSSDDHMAATYPWALGTGANMAFRRTVLEAAVTWDEHLDMGTSIGGGGDLDAWAQLLDSGFRVRYTPDAIVFHHHRGTRWDAARQFHGYGRTVGALVFKYVTSRPGHRRSAARFSWTYLRDTVRFFLRDHRGRSGIPRYLLLAEVAGIVIGPVVYGWSSRKRP